MKDYHHILFPFAYNILGSSADAEDIVQDVLTKYLSMDRGHIDNAKAYLVKSTINQSINFKKKKREVPKDGIWLPEPISTERPDTNIRSTEILSYSVLVLLEQLTAKERAVFILKKGFDYSHHEIAKTIDITIESSRKLLSRGQFKMRGHEKQKKRTPQRSNSQLDTYVRTIKSGDINALEKLLSDDILLAADGGKDIQVVKALTTGRSQVAQLVHHVFTRYLDRMELRYTYVNHLPAILYLNNGIVHNCQVFDFKDNRINNIYSIVDPSKLNSLFF